MQHCHRCTCVLTLHLSCRGSVAVVFALDPHMFKHSKAGTVGLSRAACAADYTDSSMDSINRPAKAGVTLA